MDNIKSIAQRVAELEKECQQGINVSKNLEEMDKLMASLPFEDLLKLNLEIEKNF